ncbi:LysR family transcriptional regulator [Corallococcus sp. H22C18031201]|uniref:LysR family transcriptional regulator n=1 Tax=Citreicoccus inhibens TaxID=2849499 RepID=UPI000E71EDCA|nr:LysR family transcriptional regulator [Citreicoccus inhibens]MBU8897819.1 LysR family transcriptional regulator [Citreicoccus inhibens]RJS24915.1 LysR family transcriptional regulator [Corallococcus sp. H22C18031201]
MDIPWDDVRLFLAVAEAGSVSGAARKLRLGQPTVSRRLADLEYAVGEALFRRGVSGATLTSAGERLLGPARRMAEWAGEVSRAADTADREPRGVIRITSMPFVAFDFLAPFAGKLLQKHPGMRVEVLSSVTHLDLGRGEADLALRSRAPSQADLTTVHTVEVENAVFVSRALAQRLPRRPRLQDLPWIAWAPPFEDVPPNPQLAALVPGFEPVFASDQFLVQLAAAEAGVGAMVLPRLRHGFARTSSLVPLRIDLGPHQRGPLYVVCAKSALDIPRVRRVAELLVEELERARKD